MFDRLLIKPDSLRNDVVDGETVGFSFETRIANYRGTFLSMHNGYFIEVDGVSYPVADQTFEINGVPPRTFDELKTRTWEHWDYDDAGIVHVASDGGLAAGPHTIRFQQSVLMAYGYMPTDEAWVAEAPTPGTGAGSDKTPGIVTYELVLQDEPRTLDARPGTVVVGDAAPSRPSYADSIAAMAASQEGAAR